MQACRSRYICNLYLFLRCFPREIFLMATDISHVLDVSTYCVLVYPWTKPVLVTKEDRCQTIATLARHLRSSGNVIFMNLICTMRIISRWFSRGSVRESVGGQCFVEAHLFTHVLCRIFFSEMKSFGPERAKCCSVFPGCLLHRYEAIRVRNWDEFVCLFGFFFFMVVANSNASCYWLQVHCSQW